MWVTRTPSAVAGVTREHFKHVSISLLSRACTHAGFLPALWLKVRSARCHSVPGEARGSGLGLRARPVGLSPWLCDVPFPPLHDEHSRLHTQRDWLAVFPALQGEHWPTQRRAERTLLRGPTAHPHCRGARHSTLLPLPDQATAIQCSLSRPSVHLGFPTLDEADCG